ncbi:hypothetical protein PR202_ga25043 [Eleusine coracana subsp. coracana]|uniref:O-methyltransferase ZRP4 n=1 Tax=Eleusine coracana subsp. coracana TaxID=191504 RepID=A0AAV5D8C2_ELECO|nr:hypothetical protein PR202_ga25043 [Eleusine coracana subsp. coracana]
MARSNSKAPRNMDALSTGDLMQAERQLYNHSFSYVKSMALKCAVDLGIPNIIHRRGGSATLSDLTAAAGIHSSRMPYLQRLMNLLTISGIFTKSHAPDDSCLTSSETPSGVAVLYKLTPASYLLASDDVTSMSSMLNFLVRPLTFNTFFDMHTWFKDEQATETSFFEMTHGCNRWEMTRRNAEDNRFFNDAMVADSNLVMEIFLRESGHKIFGGLNSLVDVGGGHGAVSVAIAKAFPHIKCSVLDLPHVVDQAPGNGTVQFIVGDMFKFIPQADAVLLKDIMSSETQALLDLFMMYIDGVERNEHAWAKIFHQAGFRDYKIVSVLGMRSVIEVYP